MKYFLSFRDFKPKSESVASLFRDIFCLFRSFPLPPPLLKKKPFPLNKMHFKAFPPVFYVIFTRFSFPFFMIFPKSSVLIFSSAFPFLLLVVDVDLHSHICNVASSFPWMKA